LDSMAANGLWLCSKALPYTYESPQGSSTVDLMASSLPVGAVSSPEAIAGHSMRQLRKHIPMGCRVELATTEQRPYLCRS
jgi:hypothetical protein